MVRSACFCKRNQALPEKVSKLNCSAPALRHSLKSWCVSHTQLLCRRGVTFLLDRAFDVGYSQLDFEFSFLVCNPHRDGALHVGHSQLELLFCFWACNPHRNRALGRGQGGGLLVFYFEAKRFLCSPHRDRALDVHHSQLELLFACFVRKHHRNPIDSKELLCLERRLLV